MTNKDKLRRFGVTETRLQEMLDEQGGKCAGCSTDITLHVSEKDSSWVKKACIDHDHSCCPTQKTCGKCVRGLLCGNCNRALGLLKDDIKIFQALTAYLLKYSPKD
jgi:hypothetical protein